MDDMNDKIDMLARKFGEILKEVLNKKNTKQALNDALEKSDTTEELIAEPLDKAINPDPCNHDFEDDCYNDGHGTIIRHWKCKNCGLVVKRCNP